MIRNTFSSQLIALLLTLVVILPGRAIALDYAAPTGPDPLRLRTCPLIFPGSNSERCELLGLLGPVSRVSYSFSPSGEPDLTYEFDVSGRLEEVDWRIRDILGGWTGRKFVYEA